MYTIKTGDLVPPLTVTLTEHDGTTPVDLTAAVSAVLRVQVPDDDEVTEMAMTFVDRALGRVRRTWVAGDTDVAGTYSGEIVVTWADGEQTFPARGSIRWVVEAGIGD